MFCDILFLKKGGVAMIYETIGNNIKFLRKERKMTQSELAELLFVSPQMVSRYENNGAAPDIVMLAQICQIFHVSMDTLCGLNSTSKEKQIKRLYEKYLEKSKGDFSTLCKQYEHFIIDAAGFINDERVMKIQLSLLENLHDNIENEIQHREINEKIFECATRILDLSQDDELRSYANYRMAVYYCETPFENKDYQKNLCLSKEYLRKVLMCTYFPEYTPILGVDVRSDDYTKAQIDNIDFFAGMLYKSIQQLRRSDKENGISTKYDELFCGLTKYLSGKVSESLEHNPKPSL